ncbi:MAG: hypothetical protein IMX01_09005 [Limnochordaceae bacterium]|nr:hypothetical protein [Limnochordaceae bacterium]
MAVIRRSPATDEKRELWTVAPLRRRHWLPLHRRRRRWPYIQRVATEQAGGAPGGQGWPGPGPLATGKAWRPQQRPALRRQRSTFLPVAFWRAARVWITRLFFSMVVVLTMAVSFTGALRSYPPSEVVPPPQQSNGLWLGFRWFSGDFEDSELQALLVRVQRNRLQSLFVYVGAIGPNGTLPASHGPGLVRIEQALQQAGLDRSVQVLAWVEGTRGAGAGLPPQPKLESLPVRAEVQRELGTLLTQNPVAGLHLEIQGVRDGDAAFVSWLAELRDTVLAPEQTLSVGVPPLRSRWLPGPLGKHCWSPSYMAQVAAHVNQIAVHTFDTGLPLPGLYQRWLEDQVSELLPVVLQELALRQGETLTRWASRSSRSSASQAKPAFSVLFGIPSFSERRLNHFPSAENVGVASQALIAALVRERRAVPDRLSQQLQVGYGLFADWTTQDDEWQALSHYWH